MSLGNSLIEKSEKKNTSFQHFMLYIFFCYVISINRNKNIFFFLKVWVLYIYVCLKTLNVYVCTEVYYM